MSDELTFLLILVTPAHAHLIDKIGSREQPLGSRIIEAFFKLQDKDRFNTLIAVVDRLPGPSLTKSSLRGPSTRAEVRPSSPQMPINAEKFDLHDKRPSNNCGYEGLSIIALKPEACPSIWNREHRAQKKGGDPSQPAYLQFSMDVSNVETQTVQLPVANTTFINGRPSTILLQFWHCDGPDGRGLVQKRRTYLQMADIYIIQGCTDRVETAFRTRIKPITSSRRVAKSMGNIISKIYTGDGRTGPASAELEINIDHLIKNCNMSPSTQIWALLRHNERSPIRDSEELESAIRESGARLHKVLSGGGGYGVKAGLIALEPKMRHELAPVSGNPEDELEHWNIDDEEPPEPDSELTYEDRRFHALRQDRMLQLAGEKVNDYNDYENDDVEAEGKEEYEEGYNQRERDDHGAVGVNADTTMDGCGRNIRSERTPIAASNVWPGATRGKEAESSWTQPSQHLLPVSRENFAPYTRSNKSVLEMAEKKLQSEKRQREQGKGATDDEEDFDIPFPSVVKPDDYITFFAFDEPPDQDITYLRQGYRSPLGMPICASKDFRYTFGTLPPLTDKMKKSKSVEGQGRARSNFTRGFFGMLTQGSMSLINQRIPLSMQTGQQLSSTSRDRPSTFTTMIDVPFSRLSLVRKGGERAPSVVDQNNSHKLRRSVIFKEDGSFIHLSDKQMYSRNSVLRGGPMPERGEGEYQNSQELGKETLRRLAKLAHDRGRTAPSFVQHDTGYRPNKFIQDHFKRRTDKEWGPTFFEDEDEPDRRPNTFIKDRDERQEGGERTQRFFQDDPGRRPDTSNKDHDERREGREWGSSFFQYDPGRRKPQRGRAKYEVSRARGKDYHERPNKVHGRRRTGHTKFGNR